MAQAKTPRSEIVIATWPEKRGMAYFYRDEGMFSYDDKIASCWVYLRGILPDNCYSYLDSRSVNDMALYVWISRDGTISLSLRCKDLHSAEERELEERLRCLKRLRAKVAKSYPMLDNFNYNQRAILPELLHFFAALGVKRAVEYHGINVAETYCTATDAIRKIADAIEERITRMGGWIEKKEQAAA